MPEQTDDSTVPEGWNSFPEAVRLAGIPEESIPGYLEWVGKVDPSAACLPSGLSPTGEDGETVLKGSNCVRHLLSGLLIVSSAVVDGWRQAEEKAAELQAQGWLSTEAVAEKLGISEEEVLERVRMLEQQVGEEPGTST